MNKIAMIDWLTGFSFHDNHWKAKAASLSHVAFLSDEVTRNKLVDFYPLYVVGSITKGDCLREMVTQLSVFLRLRNSLYSSASSLGEARGLKRNRTSVEMSGDYRCFSRASILVSCINIGVDIAKEKREKNRLFCSLCLTEN